MTAATDPREPLGIARGSILFIADLHLDPGVPARLEAFAGCLRVLAEREPAALYVLGDLFEVWTGETSLRDARYEPVFAALRSLSDAGTAVTVLKGNRDFLLDQRFAERAGAALVEEDVAVPLGDRLAYVCHGDRLCTGDRPYQYLRWVLRSSTVRALAAALPSRAVDAMARGLRGKSREGGLRREASGSRKPVEIPPTAAALVFRGGYDLIVAGHVHCERRGVLQVDGRPREVYTLGSWEERASVLGFDGTRLAFHHLPFA